MVIFCLFFMFLYIHIFANNLFVDESFSSINRNLSSNRQTCMQQTDNQNIKCLQVNVFIDWCNYVICFQTVLKDLNALLCILYSENKLSYISDSLRVCLSAYEITKVFSSVSFLDWNTMQPTNQAKLICIVSFNSIPQVLSIFS